MRLYEHPLSSHAQKVTIALREKGLDVTVETPAAWGTGTAGGAFADEVKATAWRTRTSGLRRVRSGASIATIIVGSG